MVRLGCAKDDDRRTSEGSGSALPRSDSALYHICMIYSGRGSCSTIPSRSWLAPEKRNEV